MKRIKVTPMRRTETTSLNELVNAALVGKWIRFPRGRKFYKILLAELNSVGDLWLRVEGKPDIYYIAGEFELSLTTEKPD